MLDIIMVFHVAKVWGMQFQDQCSENTCQEIENVVLQLQCIHMFDFFFFKKKVSLMILSLGTLENHTGTSKMLKTSSECDQ